MLDDSGGRELLAAQLGELLEEGPLGVVDLGGGLDLHDDFQVAAAGAVEAADSQPLERDDVAGVGARFDVDRPPSVEGLDVQGAAEGRGRHRHFDLAHEVVAVALEDPVLLDAHFDEEVAGPAALDSRLALAREADAHAVLHPGGDAHGDVPRGPDASLACAFRAGRDDDRAVPAAGRAHRLGDHLAEDRVRHALDRPRAAALPACDRLGARGGAGAVARRALHGQGVGDLLLGAEDDVLQLQGEGDEGVLAAPAPRGRPRADAAEEGFEDIGERPESAGHPRPAQSVVPAEVVHPPGLLVGQDGVGLVDGLELLRFARPGDVGVELAGESAVRPLDVLLGGVAGHAEGFVVV